MLTDKYRKGDLVCLSPANVVHIWNDPDVSACEAQPERFGLAVDDHVTAIVLEIKEDVEYGGEVVLLIGLQRAYMTYPAGQRPYLRKITME